MAIDRRLTARGQSLRGILVATAVSCAVALPIVLPVLPAADIGWITR